jgi:hypothetical protein
MARDSRTLRFRLIALTLPALLGGCTLELAEDTPSVDTVRVTDTVKQVDTIVRVDTVIIVDTLVATGVGLDDHAIVTPPVSAARITERDLAFLRARRLLLPVAGVAPVDLLDTFDEKRGARSHHALDIPAPRGTPVLSTDAGRVVKLHTSVAGGTTIYATDPSDRFVFYYAHLDGYRSGLAEGRLLAKGDTIGYVGTTGNAPANVPHLHFAIALMDAEKKWWKSTPIDPRPLLTVPRAGRR